MSNPRQRRRRPTRRKPTMPTALQRLIAISSNQPVVSAGARFKQNGEGSPFDFLSASNPIRGMSGYQFLNLILERNAPPPSTEIFCQYLALSNICHLLSAWRYLARAAFSILDNSTQTGLHLAYYAELRAAMSILAGAGVGILNNTHFIIDSGNNIKRFYGPTHEVAWNSLKYWSQLPTNNQLLLDKFSHMGRTGTEWSNILNVSGGLTVSWLSDWSVDLKGIGKDREFRNEASYRVDLREEWLNKLSKVNVKIIVDTNLGSVGGDHGSLPGVDLSLIRDLCIKSAFSNGLIKNTDDPSIWFRLQHLLEIKEGHSREQAYGIVNLIRNSIEQPGGFTFNQANASNHDSTGVFCRAFLLLRLATILARNNWQEMIAIAPAGILRWRNVILLQFLKHCQMPMDDDMEWGDLLVGQESTVDDMADRLNHCPVSEIHTTFPDGCLQSMRILCQLERIGIWALAS